MSSAPIPHETLLAHREWVRAVARAVVRDPNAADDVEQETWLAALRTPPREQSSLRGWFGAVTRSRARRIGRGESRREARESVVARREAAPSAADLAELADTHRRVVQAVVELDEPYRETILLRYFEGLSIEDVAQRTASPVETTRSRLKRGVAKLRERLTRELGTDERPWHLAFVPLIGGTKGSAAGTGTAVGGGVVMATTTKTAVAVAAVVLLVGIGAVVVPKWTASDAAVVAEASDDPAPPPAPPKPAEKKPERVAPRPPRERAAGDPAPPAEEPKPRVPAETVAERLAKVKLQTDWKEAKLLDVFGELAGRTNVEIVISAEAIEEWRKERRDTIGGLRLDQEVPADQILSLVTQLIGSQWVVEEPRIVIVPQGVTRDPAKPVVVPPVWTPPAAVTVIGRVTDASGVAVVGAEIVRISGEDEHVVARTDIAGRYEVKLSKPFGSLEARAPGQLPSFAVSVDGQPSAQVTLDLALSGPAGSVTVRVLSDADGKPFPDACVSVDSSKERNVKLPDGRTAVQRALQVRTDEKGTASFPGVPPGAATISVKWATGHLRASAKVDVTAGQSAALEIRLVRKPPLKEFLAKEHVSFDFRESTAKGVVQFLNDSKELSIVVDPALAATLDNRRVTLSVSDRSLDEALRALCHELGDVKYVVEGEIVFLTAEKR